MTNPKAQAAKEKGNTAFKDGDYPSAIGHYTEAILADGTDPTLALNRAAAYLKLGKNEDAERDSTTVLRLSSSNVKAFFRRAQARVALGNLLGARQDLNDALAVEPNNTSIQDEAKKVDLLITVEKSKKAKVGLARASVPTPNPVVNASSTSSPHPKRRRVPIEIVESPASQPPDVKPQQMTNPSVQPAPTTKHKVETEAMIPVSTRSLKSSSGSPAQDFQSPITTAASTTTSPIATLDPKLSPVTFSETKAKRDSSRAGGGIFRANGQNTIFSPVTTRFGSPMTMFNFNKAWETNPSVEDRWKLITSIPPTHIPSMCKSSLETFLFVSIIDVFSEVVKANAKETREVVNAYLKAFEDVPRFNTVLLFMSEKEKGRVRELWKFLGVEDLSGVWNALVR